MASAPTFLIVYCTAPSLQQARRLARVLLKKKLAACVNLSPRLESHYWWNGKIEKSQEVLLVIKTRASLFPRLEKTLAGEHPYEVPEILAVPVSQGSKKYLRWLKRSTAL